MARRDQIIHSFVRGRAWPGHPRGAWQSPGLRGYPAQGRARTI